MYPLGLYLAPCTPLPQPLTSAAKGPRVEMFFFKKFYDELDTLQKGVRSWPRVNPAPGANKKKTELRHPVNCVKRPLTHNNTIFPKVLSKSKSWTKIMKDLTFVKCWHRQNIQQSQSKYFFPFWFFLLCILLFLFSAPNDNLPQQQEMFEGDKDEKRTWGSQKRVFLLSYATEEYP